jgi:hypothetical protein
MHPASDDLCNNDQANEPTNERENTAWRQKRPRENARRAPEFKNPPRPAGTVSAQLRDTRVRHQIKLTIEFLD